ncbi:MAG: hypothetical protein IV100_00920 [Myxococcales bacterium]|nr:hypothetical protein [Myxococcales bacterium]
MSHTLRPRLLLLILVAAGCSEGSSTTLAIPPDAVDLADAVVLNDPETTSMDVEPGPGDGDDVVPVTDVEMPPDTTDQPDISDVTEPDVTTDATGPDTNSEDVATPACLTLSPSHPRHVVLSMPYDQASQKADVWQLRPLLEGGALGEPTATFEMGRATFGVVSFRADGAVGAVAQENGSIGIFSVADDGSVEVIAPKFEPDLYAETVEFNATGDTLYVVDPNWVENGGGIYTVAVGCDGKPGAVELLFESKLALAALPSPGRFLVAARSVENSQVGQLHLTSESGEVLASATVFEDLDDIMASFTVTQDRKYALVGDYSEFSGLDNRIGAIRIDGDTLTATQVVSPILDPVSMVTSPFGDAILVVSGYGNGVRVLGYEPANTTTPFVDLGEPLYAGASPKLPSSAVLVEGAQSELTGLVLIVENTAVRRMRFLGDKKVKDLGTTAEGSGVESIPGAIGVQP